MNYSAARQRPLGEADRVRQAAAAMPDWFYRTVAQRVLFCLPDKTSRVVALGLLGGLGRHAPGRAVIDFLGHMQADTHLARHVGGIRFPSPIGLGWRVDPEQRATAALAHFGVGFIEGLAETRRHVTREPGEFLSDDGVSKRGPQPLAPAGCPRLLRRVAGDGSETVELPSGVTLPVVAWAADHTSVGAENAPGVVLQVGNRTRDGGWRVPAEMPPELPGGVRAWRTRLPRDAVLIVAGGVAQPRDAVALIGAGANLVMVDAGLVFRGPGLIKRCNDALLLSAGSTAGTEQPAAEVSLFRRARFGRSRWERPLSREAH